MPMADAICAAVLAVTTTHTAGKPFSATGISDRSRRALPRAARDFAAQFAHRTELDGHGPVIGLNTGSGGRWESKKLSVERTVELARALQLGRRLRHDARHGRQVDLLTCTQC